MRVRRRRAGISVHAISGTDVVLLGLDADEAAREGLLGFAIERTDHTENQRYFLRGYKTFQDVVPQPRPGVSYSTRDHPVQSFIWSDYTAKPNHRYTYRVFPVRGQPRLLEHGPPVSVPVSTETQDGQTHAVFFNRGAIASQAYADKFGNLPPDKTSNPAKARAWLSRGLEEALLAFIRRAKSPKFAIHGAVYEFTHGPVLNALKEAASCGAAVQLCVEMGMESGKPTSTTNGNVRAIAAAGLPAGMVIPRTRRVGIPHNKFFVLLENDRPIEVWTGSTNITESGFYGQSNVGHLVRDPAVAAQFEAYWQQLKGDPTSAALRTWALAQNPIPAAEAPEGTTCIFSPRKKTAPDMLDWYAARLSDADQTAMFTAAFGINAKLATVLAEDRDYLRFIMTEKNIPKDQRDLLRRERDTVIAVGSTLGRDAKQNEIPGWQLDRWYTEELFRKQGHVFYVHTKYLVVDPLTADPLVFSGSANFSPNSLEQNDENMLLIRGDRRVADIYMTEFDRLFRHFFFRQTVNALTQAGDAPGAESTFLDPTSKWVRQHFRAGAFKSRRRELLR